MTISIQDLLKVLAENIAIVAPMALAVIGLIAVYIWRGRRARKVMAEKRVMSALILNCDLRACAIIKQDSLKDSCYVHPRVLRGKPVYFVRPYRGDPIPVPLEEQVPVPYQAPLPYLSKKIKREYAGVLKTLKYFDIVNDGHQAAEAAVAVAEPIAMPFEYEEYVVNEIPSQYRHMTPNWLYRRLHWEEQAKIARVKASGLSAGVKVGAAVIVLVLFIIVIFLFGTIIQGG